MPPIPIPTPTAAAKYAERLQRVVENFRRLGYRSRQRAAFDLRLAPSRVSGILNYREPNPELLDRLEAWSETELKARARAS